MAFERWERHESHVVGSCWAHFVIVLSISSTIIIELEMGMSSTFSCAQHLTKWLWRLLICEPLLFRDEEILLWELVLFSSDFKLLFSVLPSLTGSVSASLIDDWLEAGRLIGSERASEETSALARVSFRPCTPIECAATSLRLLIFSLHFVAEDGGGAEAWELWRSVGDSVSPP